MITTRKLAIIVILALFGALGAGCKKCQPPGEILTTFTDIEWRLVDATDDSFTDRLSNFAFLIFVFHTNFTGEVFGVENNDQDENPRLTFKFDVDSESDLIRIKWQYADGYEILDYHYDLGREFELTQNNSRKYFRFVPFTGIVEPDNDCTF